MKSRILLSALALIALCAVLYFVFSPESTPPASSPMQPNPARNTRTTKPSATAKSQSESPAAPDRIATGGGKPIVQPAVPEAAVDPRGPDRLRTMSAPPNGVAEAEVEIDGQPVRLAPNQLGIFVPRPLVQPGAQIPITVTFIEGAEGENVVANVLHGGDLDGGEAVLIRQLDEDLAVSFTFTVGKRDGLYQVAVRRGAELRTVEVWAGAPLQLAEAEPAR